MPKESFYSKTPVAPKKKIAAGTPFGTPRLSTETSPSVPKHPGRIKALVQPMKNIKSHPRARHRSK